MFNSKQCSVLVFSLTANLLGCKSTNVDNQEISQSLAAGDRSNYTPALECELSPEQMIFSKMEVLFSSRDQKFMMQMTSKESGNTQIISSDVWFNIPTNNVLISMEKSFGDILSKDKTDSNFKISSSLIFSKNGRIISARKSDGFVENGIKGCKELGGQGLFSFFKSVTSPVGKFCSAKDKTIRISKENIVKSPNDLASINGIGGRPLFREDFWYPTAYEVEVSGLSAPSASANSPEMKLRTRTIMAWGFSDLIKNKMEFFVSDKADRVLNDLSLGNSFVLDLSDRDNAGCELKSIQGDNFDLGGRP